MSEVMNSPVVLAALVLTALIFIVGGVFWWRKRNADPLTRLQRAISQDSLEGAVLADGIGGEIQIEYLMLTPRGLLLLDTIGVSGTVFAGERLDVWSANSQSGRVTFENPIPNLQARAAAVQLAVPGVPVDARLLFLGTVTFPKGHPPAVTDIESLLEEYAAAQTGEGGSVFEGQWAALKQSLIAA